MADFFEIVRENAEFIIGIFSVFLLLYLEIDTITEYISLTFAAAVLLTSIIVILLLPLNDLLQFGLLLGYLLIVGLLLRVLRKRSAKKRTERLKLVAPSLFFNFTTNGTPEILNRLKKFYPRQDAKKHIVMNLMEGEKERVNIKIFDYLFEQRIGESKRSSYSQRSQTVILFTSSRLRSPAFLLRPRTWLHKVDHHLFGKKEDNLRIDTQVYQRYLLQTEQKEKVQSFFDDNISTLSYLKQVKGIQVEIIGDQLLYFQPQKQIAPEHIETFMTEGWRIFNLFTNNEHMDEKPSYNKAFISA